MYRGALNTKPIPNEGEINETMMTEDGIVTDTNWQVAEVRKPLLAVSACNDRKNIAIFDNENSCILSDKAPEAAAIRCAQTSDHNTTDTTHETGSGKSHHYSHRQTLWFVSQCCPILMTSLVSLVESHFGTLTIVHLMYLIG